MSSLDNCSHANLISFEEALTTLLQKVVPIRDTESVPLLDSLGRVLSESILSPIDVPSFANSAMDGYALKASSLNNSKTLKMVGKAFAGSPYNKAVTEGECVRIMTGAVIPEGSDCVIMQENTSQSGTAKLGESIVFHSTPTVGDNIRIAGNDIKKEDKVLPKGQSLGAADIGLLASLGMQSVPVIRPLRVAVFSTGDELVQQGIPLRPGQIYDSNRYTVLSLLKKLGVEMRDVGNLPDEPKAIEHALMEADKWSDIIITSGGVSVGEADYLKSIIESMGRLELWKVAVKPGKPFAYGKLNRAHFIGLPGNPVSALATLYLLATPMIEKMQGKKPTSLHVIRATLESPIRKKPGRKDFQRGYFTTNQAGEVFVTTTGPQSSGVLTSMSRANCFIVLAPEQGPMDKGESVLIQPFNHLI
ncbi:gephyrin-like molybdotransferase Glp [Pleionea sediminis]|uniref:molybdopterin molybdotransferase MoeA n=1 Tax=Pleionea sediminis TaxID=2569479 RepID=UPI001186BFAF|nr:gephyrin-like molybdotransferase Glp [Pleionea sediminis]